MKAVAAVLAALVAVGVLFYVYTAPVETTAVKSLMFVMLMDAIVKPLRQRSKEEKSLVGAFARYMQRRKLFVAERAHWLYNQWQTQEMLKPKTQTATLLTVVVLTPSFSAIFR